MSLSRTTSQNSDSWCNLLSTTQCCCGKHSCAWSVPFPPWLFLLERTKPYLAAMMESQSLHVKYGSVAIHCRGRSIKCWTFKVQSSKTSNITRGQPDLTERLKLISLFLCCNPLKVLDPSQIHFPRVLRVHQVFLPCLISCRIFVSIFIQVWNCLSVYSV